MPHLKLGSKYEDNWEKEFDECAGLYWRKDEVRGNLYIHGYHPRAAVIQRFWGTALGTTVHLVQRELQFSAQRS